MSRNNLLLVLIILIGFFIRLLPLSFPSFTADEARIAVRGYSLAKSGVDELGRRFPLIFNASEDYQLPLTSYVTGLGILIFGKTEFGARILFITIGSLLILLTYFISSYFISSNRYRMLSSLIIAFSPALIYLSRFPNEWILLTCLFLLLFLNLVNKNTSNKIKLFMTIVLAILLLTTSKIAWFVLIPFVIFTIFFYQNNLFKKNKWILMGCLLLTLLVLISFLRIPQSMRSLSENNFLLFSDVTIQNGINRLRGQGIEIGWPTIIEKLLFNKSHYIFIGFLHWLSNLSPSVFFGEFDKTGQLGYIGMGAWPKILLIPFLLSIVSLIKKGGNKKIKYLWGYFILLTFPIFFLYPKNSPNIILLTLPFMALILCEGIIILKKRVIILIFFIAFLELVINFFEFNAQIKNMNELRPRWIDKIMIDGYNVSSDYRLAFSDDIASDIAPFFQWYTSASPSSDFSKLDFPYKFHKSKLGDIKIIGHEDIFYNCTKDKPTIIFASARDLKKIKGEFEIRIDRIFHDSLGKEIAYKLHPRICIK